jgi:ribosomal protein S4
LLIKSVLRKIYGKVSHNFFKKQVNLVKNKKTFLEKHLICVLENRLDVFVSRFT